MLPPAHPDTRQATVIKIKFLNYTSAENPISTLRDKKTWSNNDLTIKEVPFIRSSVTRWITEWLFESPTLSSLRHICSYNYVLCKCSSLFYREREGFLQESTAVLNPLSCHAKPCFVTVRGPKWTKKKVTYSASIFFFFTFNVCTSSVTKQVPYALAKGHYYNGLEMLKLNLRLTERGKTHTSSMFYLRANIQAVVNLPIHITNFSRWVKHSLKKNKVPSGLVLLKNRIPKLFFK